MLPTRRLQTEEALHALRSYAEHLCGGLVPALLQGRPAFHIEQVGREGRAFC